MESIAPAERSAATSERRRLLYLQARLVMARHYRRPLSLPRVAQALATSPRQLQRSFSDAGGPSFREQLIEVRMRAAAELLATQSIPVADIARLVGYRQPAHFARAFRRRYGLGPAAFRSAARAAHACREARGGPTERWR